MSDFNPDSLKSYDLTWRNILDDSAWELLTAAGYDPNGALDVYAICDSAGTVVYVGKSTNVIDRLLQHIGVGPFPRQSAVGRYLIDNTPDFVDWMVTLYVAEERWEAKVIGHYRPWFNGTLVGEGKRRIAPNPAPRGVDYDKVNEMINKALDLGDSELRS